MSDADRNFWMTIGGYAVTIVSLIVGYLKLKAGQDKIDEKVNGHTTALQQQAVTQAKEIKTLNATVATALAVKVEDDKAAAEVKALAPKTDEQPH
jgi:hypothetical protein